MIRATSVALCCLVVSTPVMAKTLEEASPPEPSDVVVVEEGTGDRVGRVAAELGAALLGAALPNLLWMPFAFAGGQSGVMVPMMALGVALIPVSTPTAAWLVHRKMGGQGLWPAAFGGTMVGAVLATGIVAAYGYATNGFQTLGPQTGLYTGLVGFGAVVVAIAATVFMIELHHDSRVIDATVAPMPGGAMGMISVKL